MEFKYIKTTEGDALAMTYDMNEKELWKRIFGKVELLCPQDSSWEEAFNENLKDFRACLWDDDDADVKADGKETKLFFGNRMITAGLLLYDLLLDNYIMNQEVTKRVLESQIRKRRDDIRKLDKTSHYKEIEKHMQEDIEEDS